MFALFYDFFPFNLGGSNFFVLLTFCLQQYYFDQQKDFFSLTFSNQYRRVPGSTEDFVVCFLNSLGNQSA